MLCEKISNALCFFDLKTEYTVENQFWKVKDQFINLIKNSDHYNNRRLKKTYPPLK